MSTETAPVGVIHDPETPPPPPWPDPPPPKVGAVRLDDHLRDPTRLWAQLADSPLAVHHDPDRGLYLLHRYADVKAALADTGRYSNTLTLMPVYQPCQAALAILAKLDVPATTAAGDNTDDTDPMHPDHRRTREALRRTWPNTAEAVAERWGQIVARRVDQAVAGVEGRRGHTVDLAAGFANPLPLWIVCDILGVPQADIGRIQAWADGQIALVWGQPDEAEQVRLAQGLLDFWRYCQDLVGRKNRDGSGGWIADCLRYRNGDDGVLALDEVASLAFNLLVAGHETTAGLIAHAIDAALSEPGLWADLGEQPDQIPAWIERTLRCRPPIDGWLRQATEDIHYGGQAIPAGARVLLLIGAANRDPNAGKPLSFGRGPHYCIGAALARLEATTALAALTARAPGLRLAGERRYRPNLAFRAHETLPAYVG